MRQFETLKPKMIIELARLTQHEIDLEVGIAVVQNAFDAGVFYADYDRGGYGLFAIKEIEFVFALDRLVEAGALWYDEGQVGYLRLCGLNAERFQKRISRRIALPSHVKEQALRLARGKCRYCDNPLEQYHFDHVIPWSRGGSNCAWNIAVSCPTCNLKKSSKTIREWGWNG